MDTRKKVNNYVWSCDYCGSEFPTKKESDKHELICKKRDREVIIKFKAPTSNTMFGLGSICIILYFLIYFVVSVNAESNGLQSKNLLQPHKWFSTEKQKDIVLAPIPTSTPTPTLIPTLIPTQKPIQKTETNVISTAEKLTNCHISDKCGGGVKRVKESECINASCCEIGDKWFLVTKVNCDKYQLMYKEAVGNASKTTFNIEQIKQQNQLPTQTVNQNTYYVVIEPTPTTSVNYADLLNDCINKANEKYNTTMRILSSYGTADSSTGVDALNQKSWEVENCKKLYQK